MAKTPRCWIVLAGVVFAVSVPPSLGGARAHAEDLRDDTFILEDQKTGSVGGSRQGEGAPARYHALRMRQILKELKISVGDKKLARFRQDPPAHYSEDQKALAHANLITFLTHDDAWDHSRKTRLKLLKDLPVGRWYFLLELDRARAEILKKHGLGHFTTNSAENLTRGVAGLMGKKIRPQTVCYARTETLENMVKGSGARGKDWSYVRFKTYPGQKTGEHNAGCFATDGENGRVEIVVDSFYNTVSTAGEWWFRKEKAAGRKIGKKCGGLFCGECACRWQDERYRTTLSSEERKKGHVFFFDFCTESPRSTTD